MNRKIKFRAKSKSTDIWLYGDLLRNEQGAFAVVPPFKMNMSNECNLYEVDEETVGQFTGLYDKAQKPIYEGDIVRSCKYKNIKHIVSYDDKVAAFVAVCIDENTGTDLETKCHITQEWIDNYPKEVIGNIYDNKELLNQE